MKLGQHFLKNEKQIKKIIGALELRAGDVVVELGAGHGELTEELGIRNYELRIIAVEKDKKLARFLREKFRDNRKIRIIEGDILKILPSIIHNSLFIIHGYKLVGNIPYYLTGYLFRAIGELENKPSLIVFTIQKEVAERLTAQPPKMNLLAASVQYWAKAEIVDYIPAGDFQPPPKVDSAIIRLFPRVPPFSSLLSFPRLAGESRIDEEKKYYEFIKVLFKQPRKTILNNLSGLKPKEELKKILKNLKIKETARPQDLDFETIKNLLRTI